MEFKEGAIFIHNGGDIIESGAIKIENHYGSDDKKQHSEEVLTEEELTRKIDFVRSRITTNRLWFPVCKYMMWHKIVSEGDFKAAVEIVQRLYPDVKLDAKDLSSLNVQSFSKGLDVWNEKDAPVRGMTFNKYYCIAQMMDAY